MEYKTIKVWISKYALTQGIFEKEVEISNNDDGCVTDKNNRIMMYIGEGKEWHKTKEGAIKRAEEMRLKKITSIEKQLEKLKNLKFD